MRKIVLEVPQEIMGDFSDKLAETGLENSITGRNDDGEIEIEVSYEKDEGELADELEEYLEQLKEEYSSQEEDEDDNDE
jgi:hypothetical protein